MSCTGKELGFDHWKEVDATELLEAHKLEFLYVQLLSYMNKMALYRGFQGNAHNCDDKYVPV
jgi:hypothetical protein